MEEQDENSKPRLFWPVQNKPRDVDRIMAAFEYTMRPNHLLSGFGFGISAEI